MLPGLHRRREVRRTDADREAVERAARHRVTVGADHEVAGRHQPALDDDLVADAITDLEDRRAVTATRTRECDRETRESPSVVGGA